MASVRPVASYLAAVAVATVCTLAVLGWLTVLLDAQPFYSDFWSFVGGGALAGLLGPPVIAAVDSRAGRAPTTDTGSVGGRTTAAALFALGGGWFALETGIGVLTHDIRVLRTREAVTGYARGLFGGGTLGAGASDVLTFLYGAGDVLVSVLGVLALLVLARFWPRFEI